jgi:CheY-like chemotaxis protein
MIAISTARDLLGRPWSYLLMSTPDANDVVQDPHRLAVLRETQLLDTAPEECFDRLTRLAASILQVPLVLISLVDEKRAFFKSGFGLPAWLEEKREISGDTFAHHTIAHDSPLTIPDTHAHAVYRQVAMVQSLGVASYAGMTIAIDGAAIGSFCAIDSKPRQWSEKDIEVLEELTRATVREIEQQRALDALRQKAAAARSVREGTRESRPAGTSTGAPERIVIAEDDASMRRLMVRTLSNNGYDIVETRDGRETLEILRRDHTSLLILDLVMPDISGWEVLEEHARNAALRSVPVIVVSAKRGPHVARALAYGIFGLLPKPFDPADLRDLVRTCLNESRKQ